MTNTLKRKSLSIVIVLALVVSMFSGLGVTASASVPATAVPYTGQTAQGDYTIQTAAQLAELSLRVNGTTGYSGSNFWLLADIDLSQSDTYGDLSWTGGTPWTAIGGMCNETNYVPVGPYFSGTFNGSPDDGANFYGVSNMNINATGIDASIMSGWGLFGAANGNIANLNVSGTINLTRASGYTGEIHYAGGIVGYTMASVYNCQANMTITVDNGANLGAVVGGIESTATTQLATPLVVEYCVGSGNVTGAFEVGGIVGGVYCQYAGNVRVGYSAYTGGTLRTTNTSQRAYVGGISGYCKGWIAYSYATNVTFATGNGHYLGGAVGHMEGRSPISSIYNSYANVIDYDNANPTYDMPFIATMDSSNVLPVSSCVWTFLGQFNQPEGTGTTNWGRWSGGTTQLSDPSLLNSTATVAILNTGATNPGFAVGTSTGYPVLAWQTGARQDVYVDPTSPSVPAIPGGTVTYPDTDPAGQIFVNGTAPSGGTGTKTSPFNNILDALSALNASTTQDTIFVTGPLTLNGSITTISSTRTDAVYIKRSSTYDGYLFNLTGGTTAVSNIIIDGNKTAFQTLATPTPTASLFAVNSGATLAIYSGAVLQNNYTGEGGAINVIGGTLNMSGGSIIYNVSEISGGGVVLHRSATFTMSGGSIGGTTTGTGNLAGNNGGGVAVYNDSVFTFSGGTIGNNTAKGEGGGVMVGSGGGHGGTLNMSGGVITENLAVTNGGGVYVDTPAQFMLTGGEISDNTAALGNGIYVTASSTLTLAPSGTNALTFGSGDKIYLPAGITFNIGATLDLANVSTIPLDFADPNTGRLTAIAGSASYAGDSAAKLTYLAGWSFVVNGVDIYLVAPSRV